ncbi:YheC/YheD family protein [Paenibacillus kobensis]|uniref:YheC/YheD family protein n=1 Tax=Paenibacillus kobensis TaxID=59841 RepID=UPI000FDA0C0E|nr:YheC/YheD family protein [Paenibacillus kobensis]
MYTKTYKSAAIWGKHKVVRYLSADAELKPLVPETLTLTADHLRTMSERFAALYIKPDIGSHGIGIHKLERTEEGYTLYSVHAKRQKQLKFAALDEAYRSIHRRKCGMIIQEAVAIDRIDEQPYDIRAMVQRKPGGSWTCTGYMVKVGQKQRIVTNFYQGGQIWTLNQLWTAKACAEEQSLELSGQLQETALRIARRLSSQKNGMREMGIDFAFDQEGKLWVLEVNSNHPQFHPLKKLDPAAYARMLAFARAYGRKTAK